MVTSFLISALLIYVATCQSMPRPFTRSLKVTSPPMHGIDVLTATTLMSRCSAWPSNVAVTNEYTSTVSNAVKQFQSYEKISSDGIFGPNTATAALWNYQYDSYIDNGTIKASDYGMKYKIFIPVYSDQKRNIETDAQLFDPNNKLLLTFKARTHGNSNQSEPWPNYDNSPGLNQFSSDGNTPTGLTYIDLNSPEPQSDEKYYGPYPVMRLIQGIKYNNITSNSVLLINQPSPMKNGILLHTGEWPGWKNGDQMPDSSGCIHVWPDMLNQIDDILTKQLGVVVHNNPYTTVNYPYKPQGIISIQYVG